MDTLLRALGYPSAPSFDAENAAQVQSLVEWLENTKIRHYPLDGRAQLHSPDPAAWTAALRQYLIDLECPLALDSAPLSEVLRWLLAHGVGLEYQDRAQAARAATDAALAAAPPLAESSERDLPPFADLASPEVQQGLRDLLALLRLDAEQVTPEAVEQASELLQGQVLPALAEVQRRGGPPGSSAPAPEGLLRSFPLGFSTGDLRVDLAATVLRTLYIRDLRDLQTLIDRSIVDVQELTANPQTDASLGKVGR